LTKTAFLKQDFEEALITMSHRCVALSAPYLSLLLRGSPPLHQETEALGEALGRHSNTTSPPLWITVDFFTGRWVKSGGEAEEETRVEAICLALWRRNSCAPAKMSSAPPAITEIRFNHQMGVLFEVIMERTKKFRGWLSLYSSIRLH